MNTGTNSKNIATFGGGCFWCTEAIFKRVRGVEEVISGFSGGHVENPSYSEVARQKTGHAESIQIEFNSKVISYEELLEIFFKTHDPTTLNKQGNDIGPEYRSIIFYHDEKQRELAKKAMPKDAVTEIVPFEKFYKAEDSHQNYYENNKNNPYCTFVIDPKVKKFLKEFEDKAVN
jgi:peptide-methionine (S)-S-oxide reductase